jgi:polyhydroxyalkanoate synthesis regulator phasin
LLPEPSANFRLDKESSQRFRDKTKERQQEKDNRLIWLEQRVRDLEAEKQKAPSTRRSDSLIDPHGHSDVEALTREVLHLREKVRQLEEEVRRTALRIEGTLTADFAPFVSLESPSASASNSA